MRKATEFCNCDQYCTLSRCRASDSGLQVKKCWCADCKDHRKEAKLNAYAITGIWEAK